LNDSGKIHTFSLKFEDKNEWHNFKDDLKNILREREIKYQYSEKVPTFHIVYQNAAIKLRVDWQDESLLAALQTTQALNPEVREACNEIFEILVLFGGELIHGSSPYDW
jgi:hypothetical protein